MSNFSEPPKHGNSNKPLINLLRGWPHPSLLPTAQILAGATSALNDPAVSVPGLLYGPDPGFPALRSNIAKWLTGFFEPGRAIEAERITITGGASQNLGCVLQVFTDAVYTRNVWCVVPCYMLAFRTFEDAGLGAKLRGVPEDEEGIDIGFLREELRKSEERAGKEGNDRPVFKPHRDYGKFYKHVVYAVPTFSNPSSKTMSMRRREELVRLAREYDALIVCDDVYDFLQWPASTQAKESAIDKALMPRLVDVDRFLDGGAERQGADGFGNVVSNGTFSKIAGPGLRTGWVEATEKFAFGVSQAGTTRSGGAPSHTTATFVSAMLASGDLHNFILNVLQPTYARRYRTMLAAIQQHLLPLGIVLPQSTREVAGGYFVWITLPEGLSGTEVAARTVAEENLVVAQGKMFEVPGDNERAGTNFESDLRLCFSWEDEEKLGEAIERLASVLKKMLQEKKEGKNTTAKGELKAGEERNFW